MDGAVHVVGLHVAGLHLVDLYVASLRPLVFILLDQETDGIVNGIGVGLPSFHELIPATA